MDHLRTCMNALRWSTSDAELNRTFKPGRSILFRPQHLSGFQVDKVHLRACQARD